MKEFIEFIIKQIVDKPDEVRVNEIAGERIFVFELSVGKGDMGMVIGRGGQTAESLRILLAAAAAKQGKRAVLEILEDEMETAIRSKRKTAHYALGKTQFIDVQNEEEIRMNIYVGNLSSDISEEDLRQAFEAFGQITSVSVIKDKFSGETRGFGFVEMPSKKEAQSAIDGLNGQELKGRSLSVNEARPRSDNRGGGGRRGGGRRF